MATPYDEATTLLSNYSNALRTVYHEDFPDQHYRYGRPINRLFRPGKKAVDGNGYTIQTKTNNLMGARVNRDANADFGRARTFGVDSYRVTFSEDPTLNDLRRVSMPLQISHWDLKRQTSQKSAAVDIVTEMIEDSKRDVMETVAIHRYLPETGLIGTVNGTPKKNDAKTMSAAAALTTTGGARFQLSSASLAIFQKGRRLDIYNGSTTKRFTVEVTDYNPADGSVGVYGVNPATDASSSTYNIGALAASDTIYIEGGYGNGLKSMGYGFSAATSGESFWGKDRTVATDRWMDIHRTGPSSSTQFQPSHLDTYATERAFISEDPDEALLAICPPDIEQRFRQAVGNDILLQYPTGEQKGKLIASYGFDGMLYRHPRLGRINFEVDALCPPNRIRFFNIGDWETYFPRGAMEFDWIPGDTVGIWSRMPSATPGNGNTLVYRAEGMMALADVCLAWRKQAEMTNITA